MQAIPATKGEKPIRLDGRAALITGAGRGLGRAYALELAARGAAVIVNDPGLNLRGDDTGDHGPADEATADIRKAGGRALINTSPEPFSNWTASLTEDAVVLTGIWFALVYPLAFLAMLLVLLVLMVWLLPKIWRGVRQLWSALRPKPG